MIFKDATDEAHNDAATSPGSADQSDRTLSLLGGVARPEGMEAADALDAELNGPGGKFSAINRGTMLLLVVIVLAVGTLYLMRMGHDKLNSGGLAADVEARINAAIDKLNSSDVTDPANPNKMITEVLDETGPLIRAFEQDTHQQVPIEFVKQNPFHIERSKKIDPVVTTDTSALEAERARERRLKELHKQFEAMRLTSVVLGARPLAIIDNELYQPGSAIGDFKVKSIDELSVVLVADGDQWGLKLNRDEPRPGKR
jgi:hypothetical protein